VLKNKQFNIFFILVSIYSIILIAYYFIGYLNYARTAKLFLTGSSSIMLFYGLYAYYKTTFFKILLIITLTITFLNLEFQAFLKDVFKVAQDDIIIMQSIFDTNLNESKEFFSQYKTYIFKHILIFFILFSLFIFIIFKNKSKVTKKGIIYIFIFYVLVHIIKTIRYSDPFFYFYHYYNEYKKEIRKVHQILSSIQHKNIKVNFDGNVKKNIVVWIIGESETKYNWSLYGYARDTNSYLSKYKDELLLLKNVIASAPATIPAFKLMLTNADKNSSKSWLQYPNIIEIAKKGGYKTYWISNHTSDKYGIMNIFANSADIKIFTNKGRARGEGNFDKSVLEPFKKALNDNINKKFIIVHLMEAHPEYSFRYPKDFSKYTFVFDDKTAKKLIKKGRNKYCIFFRNKYDNAILYSDYIKYNILKMLKNSKDNKYSTLIYNPDHGEDVCHNTNFSGHNFKAKEQWEAPMFIWPKKKFLDFNVTKEFDLDKVDNLILNILKLKIEY
jgi:heptose-I-phosphate ethanolaminephosphotransferase